MSKYKTLKKGSRFKDYQWPFIDFKKLPRIAQALKRLQSVQTENNGKSINYSLNPKFLS